MKRKVQLPRVSVRLGLDVGKETALKRLEERARGQLKVVAAGQPQLMFLVDGDLTQGLIKSSDGDYCFSVEIPPSNQADAVGYTSQAGQRVAETYRDDASRREAVEQTMACVEHSAEMFRLTAEALSGAGHPRIAVWELERESHVDTLPARQHFFWQPGRNFDVQVAGHVVPFVAPTVPIVRRVHGEASVRIRLKGPPSLDGRAPARLLESDWPVCLWEVGEDVPLHFGTLSSEERLLLCHCWYAQLDVKARAVQTISTVTFEPLAIEAVEVDLAEATKEVRSLLARSEPGKSQAPSEHDENRPSRRAMSEARLPQQS